MNATHKIILSVAFLLLGAATLLLLRGNSHDPETAFEEIKSGDLQENRQSDRYELVTQSRAKLAIPDLQLDFLDRQISEAPQTVSELTTSLKPAKPASNETLDDESRNQTDVRNAFEDSAKQTQEEQSPIPLTAPRANALDLSKASVDPKSELANVLHADDNNGKVTPVVYDQPGAKSVLVKEDRHTFTPPRIRSAKASDEAWQAGASPIPLPSATAQPTVEPKRLVPSPAIPDEAFEVQPEYVTYDGSQSVIQNSTLPPAIVTQIQQRLDYGTALAKRGAFASAEEIYFQVIRLIADTKDAQLGGLKHTTSLANALTALEEAQDFIINDLRSRVLLRVDVLADSHNTTVLHDVECSEMTTVQALQRYYDYASKEFVAACDGERMGSEALYYLGKLYGMNSQMNPDGSAMQNAKSMIMHQSALEANAENYRSSNELGVLLARYGRYTDARDMLIHSVSIQSDSTAWKNLAVVHDKLGEGKLASLAMNESQIAMREEDNGATMGERSINWVDPNEFNAMNGGDRQFVDQAMPSDQPVERVSELPPPAESKKAWWKPFSR
jgi:tetratricopeptide (TPR) repeat protein